MVARLLNRLRFQVIGLLMAENSVIIRYSSPDAGRELLIRALQELEGRQTIMLTEVVEDSLFH